MPPNDRSESGDTIPDAASSADRLQAEYLELDRRADQFQKAANGGLFGAGTDEEGMLAALRGLNKAQLGQLDEIFQDKFRDDNGHDWNLQNEIDDELGERDKERADSLLAGTGDPGEEGPLPTESRVAFERFPNLSKHLSSSDLIGAIVRYEKKHDYSTLDSVEDCVVEYGGYLTAPMPAAMREAACIPHPAEHVDGIPVVERLSIGPAQMQLRNIEQLKAKYPDQLKDVNVDKAFETEAASKLVAAYLAREVERFQTGEYGRMSRDVRFSEPKRQRFAELQQLWDAGLWEGDVSKREAALIQTYNLMNTTMLDGVRAERTY